ncbi:MAG: MJ1477/TM1410 family putative glycoside hydrolase [Hyphomicrobiaceae bacterium]
MIARARPPRGLSWPRLCVAAIRLAVALVAAGCFATASMAQTAERKGPLAHVRSWGYQLQHAKVDRIAGSPHDLVVIDYSRDGSAEGAFTAEEVQRMQTRPDGGRRMVLAYLSIGEAETYRDYWRWYWGGKWYTRWLGWLLAPSWLGPENTSWRGNFAVRYWDPGWQALIVGPGGYVERIRAAGFDGVYLDKIDSSIEPIAKRRPSALDDMRALVRRIAEVGRIGKPAFAVVPQNGEELLTDDAYVALVDGLGKEDLLYGEFTEKKANPENVIAKRITLLQRLTQAGKTVLAVEYLDDADRIAAARERLEGLGFVPYFADRPLATLRYGDLPSTAAAR